MYFPRKYILKCSLFIMNILAVTSKIKQILLGIRMESAYCVVLNDISAIVCHQSLEDELYTFKDFELLGYWLCEIMISKKLNSKYRWKVIPSYSWSRWSLEVYFGCCGTHIRTVAHRAVFVKDVKLHINPKFSLVCVWLTSFFFFQFLGIRVHLMLPRDSLDKR